MMGLPEELYSRMLEVGLAARCHKIPSLSVLIDIAQSLLSLWQQDEQPAMCFAAMILTGPTNLQAVA